MIILFLFFSQLQMLGKTNDNYNPESVIDLGPTDDLPQEFKYVEPPEAGITEGNKMLDS